MFFTVEAPLSIVRVERTLIDVGIEHPQIVSSLDDEVVLRYLELYPYSDYLHDALSILRVKVDSLTSALEEENWEKAAANREVYDKLEDLEKVIDRLKRTQERFENDCNNEMPEQWMESKARILDLVSDWKSKKTILKKYGDAQKYANDFDSDVSYGYSRYLHEIDDLYKQHIDEMNQRFKEWYAEADYNDDFEPSIQNEEISALETVPSFENDLLEMKSEQYVSAKEGFIEKLFKESSDDNKEMVLETTFYLQEWRNYVYKIVEPLAKKVLTEYFTNTCNYEKKIISTYIQHLSEEILKKNVERNSVSGQLSDDEKQLQNDNDWVRKFEDMLRNIERC